MQFILTESEYNELKQRADRYFPTLMDCSDLIRVLKKVTKTECIWVPRGPKAYRDDRTCKKCVFYKENIYCGETKYPKKETKK
jgi:hypothetical protein